MTDFQEKQIGVIHYMLNHWTPDQKIILKFIIRMYPERIGNKTAWQNTEMYKKYHKMTKRAGAILDSSSNWKDVHYEHIIPVQSTYEQLISIEPTISEIERVMSECEVIILSAEEATLLDGSPKKEYLLEGKMIAGKGLRSKGGKEERLKVIGASLDDRYINNSLDNRKNNV